MNVNNCRLVNLPKIKDDRGSLTFVENNQHIPFEIKRIFYLYDIQKNAFRADHAHIKSQELLLCLNGSFDVLLDDSIKQKKINLNSPNQGLYIPSLIWVRIVNFAPQSVCLVLTNQFYNEDDYCRNYDKFLALVNQKNGS